jgi:intergrase/recombinase
MDRALGRRFRLYDLRAFYASYMSLKGVPGQIIDLLQGRVPEGVPGASKALPSS